VTQELVTGHFWRSLASGSVIAEVIDGHARRVHVEGVKWFGLDNLQVVEGVDADGQVRKVFPIINLLGTYASTQSMTVGLIFRRAR
jgi:hypothetical protein